MNLRPFIDLYRHPKKKSFIILRWCRMMPSGASCLAWGRLLHYSRQEFRARSTDIILEAMSGFHDRTPTDGCELSGGSPDAKRARRSLAAHDLVWVELLDDSELRLVPWHKRGGGQRSSNREAQITVSTATHSENLYAMLDTLYEQCWVVFE